MSEIWDLFDEERNPLNRTCLRGEKLNVGEYHIIIEVWTINSNGEILLTLRHPDKRDYANKWEDTGGCVIAGESSKEGAVRELFEERGIVVAEEELIFIGTVKESISFTDIYVLHKDIATHDLRLCDGETTDAKWVSLETLDKMIEGETLAAYAGRRLKHVRINFEKQFRT